MGNMSGSTYTSTQNHTHSSAISKLNDDISLYIFFLNANMEQKSEETSPALLTLRYTSQVCSNWRQLVLGTSVLWGRVVNFKVLSQRDGRWRKEVIRRTGTAPLHIIVFNDHDVWTEILYFIQGILNAHWDRVRCLDLEFTSLFMNITPWPRILGRPAPSLQIFRGSWPAIAGYGYPWTPPGCVLFSNQAPLLQTLSVTNIGPSLSTLAVSNLRNLILHSKAFRPSPFDLLRALGCMPLLESLEVSTDEAPTMPEQLPQSAKPTPPLPHVTLPQLIHIQFLLVNEVDSTLSLLAHVTPAKGCTLDFFSWYASQSPDAASTNLQRNTLSRYSRNCAELATATRLDLCLSLNQCSFSAIVASNRRFRFGLEQMPPGLPERTLCVLLPSLANLQLDKITTLRLSLSPLPGLPHLEIQYFIRSLVSVESLIVDPQTLSVLHAIQSQNAAVLIPTLRTVRLNHLCQPDHLNFVVSFLNSRIALDASGPTLSLVIGPCNTVDLAILKSIDGVEVTITGNDETLEED